MTSPARTAAAARYPAVSSRPRLSFVLAMAWRESRASARRLSLLVAAVAVGVAALVAINSFTENLTASVRAQAQTILGADVVVGSATPFTTAAEAVVSEMAGTRVGGAGTEVSRVTRFGAMAYVPRTSGNRLVQVSALQGGYPFYGTIETDPPGLWGTLQSSRGVLVDRSLLDLLQARVGDTLALGEARFEIRGTVENLPGDVGMRAALGPRVFVGDPYVSETRLLGYGSRARYEAYFKLPPGTPVPRLAERYRPQLAAERATLRTVFEDQDAVNDSFGRMGRFLGLVALVALLLGGLGVASAVHVFIQRRTETIAVLRCLGAPARQVLAVYLVQATLMGLLGSLAGAALGVGVQTALPWVLGDFLPVDVEVRPSWRALGAGVGVGLWVASMFSLLPLLAVRHVSPLLVFRRDYEAPRGGRRDVLRWLARLALALSVGGMAVLQADSVPTGLSFAGGIGIALGALWLAALGLVRGIRRFFPSGLPYLWRQGLANLYRPANQTVTVVLSLGFGAFLLNTLFLVQHNLLRSFRLDGTGERPNVVFFDVQPDQRDGLLELVREEGFAVEPAVPIVPMRIESVNGTRAAGVIGASAPTPGSPEASRHWALRREYRSTFRDTLVSSERLVAGAVWKPGEWRDAGRDAHVPVSLADGIAADLGVGVGDEIVWDVQGVPVPSRVAAIREVDWRRFEPNFFAVFPEGPLDAAPRTYVALTRIEDPQDRSRLQRRVLESYPNATVLDLSQIQQAIELVLSRVTLAVRFMALFSLATGAVVLLGAVATSRYQRLKEGVVLKALGATRNQVARVLLAEYLSLGTLAAASAFGLATAAGWALQRFRFETSFVLPLVPMGALAFGVVALTVAVGLWSSWDVARRPALDVLRAE